MVATVFGMTVFLQPPISALVLVLMMALQLFRESYTVFPASTMICSKLEHPRIGFVPMEVTELGMVIEVRLEQKENASLSMEITELGMSIEVKPVH